MGHNGPQGRREIYTVDELRGKVVLELENSDAPEEGTAKSSAAAESIIIQYPCFFRRLQTDAKRTRVYRRF